MSSGLRWVVGLRPMSCRTSASTSIYTNEAEVKPTLCAHSQRQLNHISTEGGVTVTSGELESEA
eukprot:9232432-Alexandrium_andersonii.AAC.1